MARHHISWFASEIVALALALSATPARAHHRHTPPIVQITTSSADDALPRLPVLGNVPVVALDTKTGRQIFQVQFWPHGADRRLLVPVTSRGRSDNPVASQSGAVIAFDSDAASLGSSDPGRQVFMVLRGTLVQVTHDPTGSSIKPALNASGSLLAFESAGDLAARSTPGTPQIFVWRPNAAVAQVTSGSGASHAPALDGGGRVLAFESTTDPATGEDGGTSQIWLADLVTGTSRPIAAGRGTSRAPVISGDGRVLVFEGTAAGSPVSQIVAYDLVTDELIQITDDPAGCSQPTVQGFGQTWRIAFACGGQGFFYELPDRRRFPVPTGGHTSQVVAELGVNFIMLSTTANLLGTGTSTGHQLYLWNLFAHPIAPVTTTTLVTTTTMRVTTTDTALGTTTSTSTTTTTLPTCATSAYPECGGPCPPGQHCVPFGECFCVPDVSR